jgi:hypothetical protein
MLQKAIEVEDLASRTSPYTVSITNSTVEKIANGAQSGASRYNVKTTHSQISNRINAPKTSPKIKKNLQHQSVACLFVDGAVVCFVTIDRDDNLLSETPCVIVIQFQDERDVPRALTKIRLATDVQILQVDAPVYAYEPILRALQQKPDIPLSQEILLWDQNSCAVAADAALLHVARSIQSYSGEDLKPILQTTGSVKLDKAQKDSLLSCFERRVSLIQGPPGRILNHRQLLCD